MKTKTDVMNRLKMIAKEVQDEESAKMNAMLAPEPYDCDVESQTTIIRYKAQPWEQNHRGEIHGGAVAAMFDTAMGMSVIGITDNDSVATADLDVSFIRPFTGEYFLFEVNIIRAGRTMARVRALAKDQESGKILASATSNFVYTDR